MVWPTMSPDGLRVQVFRTVPPASMTLMSTVSWPPTFLNVCLKVYQPLLETASASAGNAGPRRPVGVVAGAHQELPGNGRVRAGVEDEVAAISAGSVADGRVPVEPQVVADGSLLRHVEVDVDRGREAVGREGGAVATEPGEHVGVLGRRGMPSARRRLDRVLRPDSGSRWTPTQCRESCRRRG